jgi:hypothetical protein
MTSRNRRAGAWALALFGAVLVLGIASPAFAAAGPTRPEQAATTVQGTTAAATTALQASSSTVTGTSIVTAINDPASTRRVHEIIAALVALAALLVFMSIWYWRSTRPVHPALDGLDVLGSNSYWRAGADKRDRKLERLRNRRGNVAERVADAERPERDPTPWEPVAVPAQAALAGAGAAASSVSAEHAEVEADEADVEDEADAPVAHDADGAAEEEIEPGLLGLDDDHAFQGWEDEPLSLDGGDYPDHADHAEHADDAEHAGHADHLESAAEADRDEHPVRPDDAGEVHRAGLDSHLVDGQGEPAPDEPGQPVAGAS